MNPIAIAIKGKGLFNFLRRVVNIVKHYGVTLGKMDHALSQFARLLRRFECSATFPVTSIALRRNFKVIQKYRDEEGFEFAVHGFRHIDYEQLSLEEQLTQLAWARDIFEEFGIQVYGFRGPYLHANANTLLALQNQNLVYDSSQGLAWDVLNGRETTAYLDALKFYNARSATDYPSLPSLEEGLVCMPYSLPDDEALVERLAFETTEQMKDPWRAILHRTHGLGELFVLGLHPERVTHCKEALEAVLAEARQLKPTVWIACLKEIATWWRERAATKVEVAFDEGGFHLFVDGPAGTTVLVRNVTVDMSTDSWTKGYRQVKAMAFTVRAAQRPFIGLSPDISPKLASFLRQQGYITEINEDSRFYSYYFDQHTFEAVHQRQLLTKLESTTRPLVRLGRWPYGARSAMAITGDIDALTLWDYGLRFFGK